VEDEHIVHRIENNVVGRKEAPVGQDGHEDQVEEVRPEEDQSQLITPTVKRIVAYWKESKVKMYLFFFQFSMMK
jgi:hypothetical protein